MQAVEEGCSYLCDRQQKGMTSAIPGSLHQDGFKDVMHLWKRQGRRPAQARAL